ncbi:MAG: B12-binding domain-containing radical SAM protein [bacterium]
MKRKILMIYPQIPPTYWSFKYALPFIGKKAAIPPLGLLTVAALLPPSYDVKLIDMNVHPLSDEEIAEADLVFISAMIVQKNSFAQVAKQCKNLGATVVAGGPYPSSSYQTIEHIDHFVLNEAEITLPHFFQDLEIGRAKQIYNDHGKADIKNSPAPRFDLIKMSDYHTMPLQYSRGCPFNCEFCDIIEMFGHQMRTKTNQQIIKELKILFYLGWRGSVFIVDDNFIGHKRNVKELLPVIAQWQRKHHYPFDLFTEASINLADDPELLDLMSAAGFNMVFVGIETPDKNTLVSTGKKQNTKGDLLQSVATIQSKGIEVAGGFIVGFDSDPSDIFDRQIEFIQQSGIVLAMVGLLTALPNTQLYRRLEQEGRLLAESTGNNTHDLSLNFQPKIALQQILDGYKHIIEHIYSPKAYFDRSLTFLMNLHPHQNSARKVKREEIIAFIKSIAKQGFSSYSFYYWRFLIKAFLIEPRMFPEAVRLAIMGYHFFVITQQIIAVDELKKNYDIDELKCQYQKLISNIRNFDSPAKLRELKIVTDSLIAEITERYSDIHKDFRDLASEWYKNTINLLNELYQNYSSQVSEGCG